MLMEPVDAPACWWPCACITCVSGLRRLERIFNFLRSLHVFDLVLKYGSDKNEGNWLQLLFYIFVLVVIVVSVIGIKFFSCVSSFRLNFSPIALWRKRLQLDSKSDLTMTALFLESFWSAYASFRRHHVCMDWNLDDLLNCFSFWRHQIFSIVSRGIFWSVL